MSDSIPSGLPSLGDTPAVSKGRKMSKQAKSQTVYMHTLDGFPAVYVEGEQICYAPGLVDRFATSLKQIRREQQRSQKWRAAQGLGGFSVYSYVRIRLPQ